MAQPEVGKDPIAQRAFDRYNNNQQMFNEEEIGFMKVYKERMEIVTTGTQVQKDQMKELKLKDHKQYSDLMKMQNWTNYYARETQIRGMRFMKIVEENNDLRDKIRDKIYAGTLVQDTRYLVPEFGTNNEITDTGMEYITNQISHRYYKSRQEHTISPMQIILLHHEMVERLKLDPFWSIEVLEMFFRHGQVLEMLWNITADAPPSFNLVRTLYDTLLNFERFDNPAAIRNKLDRLVSNLRKAPLADTLLEIYSACLKTHEESPINFRNQRGCASALNSIELYLRNHYPPEQIDKVLRLHEQHIDRDKTELYSVRSVNMLVNIAKNNF